MIQVITQKGCYIFSAREYTLMLEAIKMAPPYGIQNGSSFAKI
jgi:hypothetical protein